MATVVDEQEGGVMTTEIRHLREVFEQRFSNLEAWLDHFQQYMQRVTSVVEELGKSHVELALLRQKSADNDAKFESLEKKCSDLKGECDALKQQMAVTNVVKHAVTWLAGACIGGVIAFLVKVMAG